MPKQIIAIDIDDVLADNAAGFIAYTNQKWGTNLSVLDYEEHWGKVWQTEHDMAETIRRRDEFIESRIHRAYTPVDQAHRVLTRLSSDFELRIVTSRLRIMQDDTKEWLHEHYKGIFQDETVHYAGIWDTLIEHSVSATKADLVEQIGASYLIDDQLKHCVAVAEKGITALLYGDFGWNQIDVMPVNMKRVRDWSAVEAYFYEKR